MDEKALSPLHPMASLPFWEDGIQCSSMESYLQSLKYPDANTRQHISGLSGHQARTVGQRSHPEVLYSCGRPRKRGDEQLLFHIEWAYHKLCSYPDFCLALLTAPEALSCRDIGYEPDPDILTEAEWIALLEETRSHLREYLGMTLWEKGLAVLPSSIRNDFGPDFLFSFEERPVSRQDLEAYTAGSLTADEKFGVSWHTSRLRVYTGGPYPKVLHFYKNIPTFDSGDREYDSWHELYLVREADGGLHALYRTGGYRVAKTLGYARVYRYPESLKQYLE